MTGNVDGQNHIAFKNLRNIIDRTVSHCIVGYNNTGIIFDHIDVTNCNNGISVSFTGTGNEIRFSNFTQIRGDAALSVGADGTSWDEIEIHDNYIETLVNNTPPQGQSSYGGPDGIQCYGGMSAYRNTFKVSNTSVYTSSQHPDIFQLQGNYLKIYGNEFINVGDSHIDYDCYNNSTKAPYIYYNGTSSPAASWIAAKEPLGKTGAPTFVSYSPKNINNNLHLASTDNVAKDAGVSLGSYFTTDKDGITRPQGSAWNIGAYE